MKYRRPLLMLIAAWVMLVPAQAAAIKHVIIVMMENTDATDIYGNAINAPYINSTLMPIAARAGNYVDVLPLNIPSEPHYVVLEAGKASFSDHTFTNDDPPSATNSTSSRSHLAHQIMTSTLVPQPTWMTYQESINAGTGTCPIFNLTPYAAKHDPFVFFQDISGNPPNQNNAKCTAHHRPYTQFASDLAANQLASYVFITPNLCNDMHSVCTAFTRFQQGDSWLASELPRMIDWANANAGAIFIVWDEGSLTTTMPFFAVGPGVKKGFVSNIKLSHKSVLKSVEMILGLAVLQPVATANTLSSLFKAGQFP